MAAEIILGLAVLSIPFFILFLVKICGETSRMKICKVLRADTEPLATSIALANNEPEPRPRPAISAERNANKNLIEMPKRAA